METLCQRDWLTLHEAVLELHAPGSFATLPARLIAAARRLVPCETMTVQDDRGGAAQIPWIVTGRGAWQPEPGGGVRMMHLAEQDFTLLREAFFACSAERHPHTAYYRETGDGATLRISDVMPTGQLRRTRFFNEISRPMQIRWQLTFYAPLPDGGTLMLAACRKQTDFSARDLTVFDLLRPHAISAWQRALAHEQQLARSEQWTREFPQLRIDDQPSTRAALRRGLGVTEREAQVLIWLAQGKTNAEIEIILEMSRSTVKTHLAHVFAKLNCETRTAAARMAMEALWRMTGGMTSQIPPAPKGLHSRGAGRGF